MKNKNLVIFSAFLVFIVLTVVFIVLQMQIPQTQKIKTKATGSGAVEVLLFPASQSLQPNEAITVNVVLKNVTNDPLKGFSSPQNFQLNTAGVDLQFDQNVFTVSDIFCNSSFLSNVAKAEATDKIYLTCMSSGGNMKSLDAGQQVNLGSFVLTVKSSAANGASTLAFTRTLVPNAGDESYADLSDSGTSGIYTVINGGPTLTPTVTVTPSLTPTATLTPTITPSLTPTVTLTPTATGSPNTFNKTFILKLRDVDLTQNQAINDYRLSSAGVVNANWTMYTKGNVSDMVTGTATLAYNSQTGTYSMNLINIPDKYLTNSILLVKANKHLRAKFCSNTQSSRCTWQNEQAGGLNLSGSQALNLSMYPLLPGDTNQDGVLNGQDLVEMLIQQATFPSARNLRFDLNYDGIVNGADYGSMLSSMIVYDDE